METGKQTHAQAYTRESQADKTTDRQTCSRKKRHLKPNCGCDRLSMQWIRQLGVVQTFFHRDGAPHANQILKGSTHKEKENQKTPQ
jgi:hypothetical protein